MSLPSDRRPDFETVGLGSVFIRMTEKFRADVVRRALTSRLLKNSRRNCPEKGVTEIK